MPKLPILRRLPDDDTSPKKSVYNDEIPYTGDFIKTIFTSIKLMRTLKKIWESLAFMVNFSRIFQTWSQWWKTISNFPGSYQFDLNSFVFFRINIIFWKTVIYSKYFCK